MRQGYTTAQIEYLREAHQTMRYKPLTAAFNQKFSQNRTEKAIRSALRKHKIPSGFRPGFENGERKIITDSQIEWLSINYKNLPVTLLTIAYNRLFKLNKTERQIKGTLSRYKIHSGRTGQFNKGLTPWNTGTKGLVKPNSGNFKKGATPPNLNPIGHERIDKKDGYIIIKTDEQNPNTGFKGWYRHKHIVIWEQHHGPAPEGHIVTFKDGNKRNTEIDNLECISRAEHCNRNRLKLGNQPQELRTTVRSLAKLMTVTQQKSSDATAQT